MQRFGVPQVTVEVEFDACTDEKEQMSDGD